MNVQNFITSVVDKYISLKTYKVPQKDVNIINHEKYIKAKKKLLEIACKMIVIGYDKKEITNITGIYNEKLEEL